jgi:O-antigen/teichoic acid export membrane protein
MEATRGRWIGYASTFLVSFLALASMMIVMKLAASHWGPQGFGEYVVARKAIGVLQLTFMCGMNLALMRHVASASIRQEKRAEEAGAYLLAATAFVLLASTVASGGLWLFSELVSRMLFGTGGHQDLVRGMSLAVIGGTLQGVAHGWLWGRMQVFHANLLHLLNMSLLPLLVFSYPAASPATAFVLLGGGWCLVAGGAICLSVRRALFATAPAQVGSAMRELIRYGAPRVPGEFVLGAYFAVPTVIAAHVGGLQVAGYVGVGLAFVSLIGSTFAPATQILLPAATVLVARQQRARLHRLVRTVILAALASASLLAAATVALAPWLVDWYLGSGFETAVPYVRIITLGAIPYCTYIVARGVLDALHAFPHNAKNLTLAFTILLLLAACYPSGTGIAVAVTGSLLVLGGLSLYDTVRLLKDHGGESARPAQTSDVGGFRRAA